MNNAEMERVLRLAPEVFLKLVEVIRLVGGKGVEELEELTKTGAFRTRLHIARQICCMLDPNALLYINLSGDTITTQKDSGMSFSARRFRSFRLEPVRRRRGDVLVSEIRAIAQRKGINFGIDLLKWIVRNEERIQKMYNRGIDNFTFIAIPGLLVQATGCSDRMIFLRFQLGKLTIFTKHITSFVGKDTLLVVPGGKR